MYFVKFQILNSVNYGTKKSDHQFFFYKFVFSKKTGRKPTPEPLLHLINVIGNLYSSYSLAQPMNYPVIGLSRLDLLRQ